MIKLSNFKHWKTSVIGLGLIIYSGWLQYDLIQQNQLEMNTTILATGLIGLCLLFIPDTLFEVLKKFISKKADNG